MAETAYTYDLLDRRTETRPKLWQYGVGSSKELVSRVAYDGVSNVTSVTDPLGRTTTFAYDGAERRIEATDPAGNRTEYVLDAAGNAITTTTHEVTPGGGTVSVVETAEYDALSRPRATLDALGNRTTFAYDARDHLRVVTDAGGYVTTHSYDGLDRRTKTERPEGIVEVFDYDPASRLTGYVDAQGHRTSYVYDAQDRLTRRTYPDATVYTYAYDASHNVTQLTDPNGSTITQTWDEANRMTGRSVALGAGVAGPSVESYAFDGLDRLVSATSGGVTTTLGLDSLSRTVSETTLGRTVSYTHDDVSNVSELLYPSGLKVGRGYDPLDRVVTVGPESTTPGVFDASASFSYRGPYLRAGKQLGNGVDLQRQHDPARRMLEVAGHNANDWLIFQERLGWSPRNLKTHQVRRDRARSDSTFGYDGAARLTIRSGDAVPSVPPNNVATGSEAFQTVRNGEAYGLDSAQNLVSRQSVRDGMAGAVIPLTPDGSGRNRPGTMGGVNLAYDANGNLIAKGDLRFEYDFRNRLTRVTDSIGTELATYTYDAFNRRVRKTVGATVQDAVWSGWQRVEEYSDGTLSRRRLFGSGLDEIVHEQADVDGDGSLETGYYPLYDSTGNLVALTGDDGTAFERYRYRPFGAVETIEVDALAPLIRQLLIRGDEIRFDLTEEVVPDEVFDAATDGRIRVEDVGTGTALDFEVRLPSIPAPAPSQSTTAVESVSAASTLPASSEAVSSSGSLTTTLSYSSDQQVRRLGLGLVTPPAAGTELRLVVAADALRDPFGNAATTGVDQTFPWPAEETVLSDTGPPAVHAVRLRQGYLEIELDEEPDLATVPSAITVTPSGGSPLALTWSGLGDGFTVRSDQTLPAGTFDLQVGTELQDLAGTALLAAYVEQFVVVGADADLEVFEAPDERVIPTSSVGNLHGFHGHPRDPETGLIYVRNRYYDPELGRFISPDPLGYVDGPSMYAFAGYSPVNFGDPLGLYLGETDAAKLEADAEERARQKKIQTLREGLARVEREIRVRQVTVEFLGSSRGLGPVEQRVGLAQHLRSEGLAPGPSRISHQEAARLLGSLPCDGTREVLCHFEGSGRHARWMETTTLIATDLAMGGLASASYAVGSRPWMLVPDGAGTMGPGQLARPLYTVVPRGTPNLSSRGFRPPPGTRVVPEGVPEGWRIRPTQGKGGVWYVDPQNPGNAVRVMPGNPNSPFPNSRVPYVRWQRNGQALDAAGNVVPSKSPGAHIPLEDFRFNPDLFQ